MMYFYGAQLKLQLLKMFDKNTSFMTYFYGAQLKLQLLKMFDKNTSFMTYFYRTFLTIVTLARLKYELPDDGHRQKHVGAFQFEF